MERSAQILFNLLFNSAFSFLGGLFAIYLVVRLFRVEEGRWKLFFFLLPFLKVLYDLFKGIPKSSFIFTGINPLDLPPRHGLLSIEAGFSQLGPFYNVILHIKDFIGHLYSISVPDFLYAYISKHTFPTAPTYLLGLAILISFFLVLRRALAFAVFELKRARKRKQYGETLEKRELSWRTVDIYTIQGESTPFTGGLFRPYICLPKKIYKATTPSERTAIIEHEISHIHNFDLPLSLFIRFLGDLLWFIPLYRWLGKKIDRLREIIADAGAIKRGICPEILAQALTKAGQLKLRSNPNVFYSAFFKEQSLLSKRVQLLLNVPRPHARFGWDFVLVKLVIALFTLNLVFFSTLGGNYDHQVYLFPKWVEGLLNFFWGGLLLP